MRDERVLGMHPGNLNVFFITFIYKLPFVKYFISIVADSNVLIDVFLLESKYNRFELE